MSPSFERGETGRAYVGRIAGAAREGRGCPVSNFSFYAVAISDPKACSVGLAVSPHIRREATPIQFVVAPNDGNGAMPVLPNNSGHRATPLSRHIARENLNLTLRRQPASDALREVPNSDPVGALHSSRMEQPSVQFVAPDYVKRRSRIRA